MARRMRELDWSQTALGPVDAWPQSLRTSVSTCLDCAFPIVLWWGHDLSILYNDEYAQIMGPAKATWALGQPGREVWKEIWDVIDPMLSQVIRRGEPTRSRDLMLLINRRGFAEEAYFSFSYSPIRAEDGKIGGIFCPVIETTDKVIGERRLRTLRDLASRCKGAESEDAVYAAAGDVLSTNPRGIPFALMYRIDDRQKSASLVCTVGIPRGTAASPEIVGLDDDSACAWSLREVARTGQTAIVTNLASRFSPLPTGVWTTAPHTALALPVMLPGQEHPAAILVAATSPMLSLDDGYRTFFNLIATQIASGLADAQAIEAERRRAQALAELDRAKTAFFSNVSHEFRTPLTLMIGPIEDLLANGAGALTPDAAATLDVARRNSMRLLKLVNTLLDFSRIEAGRIDASYEATDLAAATAELASVFRSAIEKAGLRFVVRCEPLPEPVYVDRDMWEKIVLNLLSNALKFTLEGEIEVSLRWRGDFADLAVRDTGCGIAESDLPLVFRRFHRIRHTRARTHEGTGIGLALVQELSRFHGGSVDVASRPGQGTTFTVSIRTGAAHLAQDRIASPRQLESTSVGASPYVDEAMRWMDASSIGELPAPGVPTQAPQVRVLIADDNADMRDYLQRMLSSHYQVDAVADGRAALERILDQPPDLVLSDVMMPLLDGFGLLAAIRADSRTSSIPVMLLSARAGEEARIEGLAAGADDYLVKPFSARELLARVASQLAMAKLRTENEKALRYLNDERRALLDRAPIGIYLIDADFRIREVNPVAEPVFGNVPGGVTGRDFDEIIHLLWSNDYADEIVRLFRNTLDTGVSHVEHERAEFRIDRQVAEYYDWRIDRITLPDGRFGLVCCFRDISEQVQARNRIAESERRLLEADRRKDEFLALLAHELRNPLAPIRTGLELIRVSGDRPATVRRVRGMMERQIGHMVRLIDDLLDVSRITSGKIVLRKVPTPVRDLIRSAVDAQHAAIDEAGLTLTTEIRDGGAVVDVDPTRFVQVLSNVLHNAVKFTPPPGAIHVSACTSEGPAGDGILMVRVADTGVGIAPDMQSRIFDLFTQAEQADGHQHGGLGIGLALARRLLEMHGGTIAASSDGQNLGSTFDITLPLSRASAETATPRPEVRRISSRVLIVDDNADAAKTMAMLVEALGGVAQTADDGVTGLEAIGTFQPDIVFLDIGMPAVDGYEACRRIRALPSDRHIVVVAVTGWGHPQDKQRAIDAGFDAHLTKPVDPAAVEELLAVTSPGAGQTA
jgi:PAS domain S-box-containing protein